MLSEEIYRGSCSTEARDLPRCLFYQGLFSTEVLYLGSGTSGGSIPDLPYKLLYAKRCLRKDLWRQQKWKEMQPIRILPYELVQEHAQGKEVSTDACVAHCGSGTHRSSLWRHGVSPVRGGAVVPASPPATPCGGTVAQGSSLGVRCVWGEESEREREGMKR